MLLANTNSNVLEVTDRALLVVALLLFSFASYHLFHTGNQVGVDAFSVELGNLITKGQIKRRHAKSLHWESIEGESKVYLRDIIYTPTTSSAEFRWGKDHSLTVEPNSMVQFDEVSLDRIEIQLIEGKVKGDTSAKTGVRVKRIEVAPRIIPYPRTVRLGSSASAEGLRLSLEELDSRLDRLLQKKTPLEVPAPFQNARTVILNVTDFDLRLGSPQGKAITLTKNKWIKMEWHPLPLKNVSYQLEISRERSFQRIISHKTEGAMLSIQLEDEGLYYWRVKASEGGKTIVSPVSNFTMLVKK